MTRLLCYFLFLHTASPAFPNDVEQMPTWENRASKKPQVILEVIELCSGMCFVRANRISFHLYDDRTAEFVAASAPSFDDVGANIILKKEVRLSEQETTELMTLAQSQELLKAAPMYDSKAKLSDATYLKLISYKHNGEKKTIILKNFGWDDIDAIEFLPRPAKVIMRKVRQLRVHIDEVNKK